MQASGSGIKVVRTLRINHQQPRIRIEKWVSNNYNNSNHCPHLGQSITISKADNDCIILSIALITINFEDLFLQPVSIPRERNIKVDTERL